MEGGEVRKRRRSTNSVDALSGEGIVESRPNVSEASLKGSVRRSFDLEHEATRQDEIVEFLRSRDSSVHGILKFGENTMRLLGEIYRIAEARGEHMKGHIPAFSIPYPEVISAMKQTVEGLIEDVADVKNRVLSQRKVMTSAQSVSATKNFAIHEVSGSSRKNKKEAPQQAEAENLEQAKRVPQPEEEDAVPSYRDGLACSKPQLIEVKPRLRRKTTRIMCQNCLVKPRYSVILRCKHSLNCNECLRAGKENVSNCTGCGKDITHTVADIVI